MIPKDPPKDIRPDPQWSRSRTGRFHRLINLDPEAVGLKGQAGVYVVWHAGVRPRWLFVGRGDDLAAVFHRVAENEEIMSYEIHGGIYVTWSLIRGEFQSGVVRYLIDTLKPLIANPDPGLAKAKPVAVQPPRDRPAES